MDLVKNEILLITDLYFIKRLKNVLLIPTYRNTNNTFATIPFESKTKFNNVKVFFIF